MDLYLIIINSCNLHCDFCIRNNLRTIAEGRINISTFVMVLDLMCKNFDIKRVILTGGEPTLHPDIISFIALCIERRLKVIITSNGTFSTNIAEKLTYYFGKGLYLQMSLDGPSYVHDRLRGKNTFNKVIKNLLFFSQYKDYIIIATTVCKSTMHEIRNLAETLNNYDFHHWKVSPEQLESPTKETIIPSDTWNNFVDNLIVLCRFRLHIKKMFDFNLWDRALKSSEINYEQIVNNCGLGKAKIYIDHECNIFPCTCMPLSIGNLKKDKVEKIKEQLQKISCIHPAADSICSKCKYGIICNGGCPGYSYKCFGVHNMGDIRCPLIVR